MQPYTPRTCLLVRQLQQELGLTSLECGQLVLNLNQGVLASHDVHSHHRGAPGEQDKDLDRARRSA
jgi:hypothetical protein